MKKYTIVWSITIPTDKGPYTSTYMDRIQVEDLKSFLKEEDLASLVSFILEGWPLQEGETQDDVKETSYYKV